MPNVGPRAIVKHLVHFAQREHEEKRPKSVKVYRLKSKSVLTRGVLPSLQVKQLGPIAYIVIADYGEQIRIYQFSREGILVSGENVELTPKLVKQLKTSTSLVYQLPKKEPITHPKDATRQLQEIVQSHLHRIAHLIPGKINLPFSFMAAPTRAFNPNARDFGCRRTETALEVPLKAIPAPAIEIIIIKAIMKHYLLAQLRISPAIPMNAMDDIASALTFIYIGCVEGKIFLSSMRDEYGFKPRNASLDFPRLIKEFIAKFPSRHQEVSLTRPRLASIFTNVHALVSVSRTHDLTLIPEDLYCFTEELVNALSTSMSRSPEHGLTLLERWKKSDIARFYDSVFSKSRALVPQEYQYEREVLQRVFQAALQSITPQNVGSILQYFKDAISCRASLPDIGNLERLFTSFVIEPIIEHLLHHDITPSRDPLLQLWNVRVVLRGLAPIMPQIAKLDISWNPASRLEIVPFSKQASPQEADGDYIYTLQFKVRSSGKVTFTVRGTTANPLFPEREYSFKKTFTYHLNGD